MSGDKPSDQGYKTVMKEFDYYNNDVDDFEILDEIPTNYINPTPDTKDNHNNNQDNTQKKIDMTKISEQRKKLQKFVTGLFKIIFYSRNKLSEFSSRSRQKLDEDKKFGNIFPSLEELTAYDDLKDWTDISDSKKQKYIIDFFLHKKNSKDFEKTGTEKDNYGSKLLIERWKIKYKENFIFKTSNTLKNNTDEQIDKQFKIIEKGVILYSHILPLYNISRDKKYYVEFKFNPNVKVRKNFVDNNLTKKIKIIKEELFNFKISITYLKFKTENIKLLLKKSINDFVIIPSKKSRMRFLSDKYDKKSSTQLIKKESKDENKENNNKNLINHFIIDNYFNDIQDNSEKKNIINKRRLSVKEKKTKDIYNYSDDNDNSFDNSNTDESLDLVLSGSIDNNESESNKKINDINDKKEKIKQKMKSKEIKNNKNKIVPKCQTFNVKSKTNLKGNNFEFKNNKITKIFKEYKNIKRMMETMPNYGSINCDKLSTFISNN